MDEGQGAADGWTGEKAEKVGRLGAEWRRLSHPRRRRRRRNRGGERSSVSIMFEIKGRLVPPAALLFKSGPEGGREGGEVVVCINENAGTSSINHPSFSTAINKLAFHCNLQVYDKKKKKPNVSNVPLWNQNRAKTPQERLFSLTGAAARCKR